MLTEDSNKSLPTTDILYFYIDRRTKLGTRIIIPNNASLTRG